LISKSGLLLIGSLIAPASECTRTSRRYKINGTILSREIAASDNSAVSQYPLFSPFGINGGFYYVKAAYKF